jgi:hypothetical protein
MRTLILSSAFAITFCWAAAVLLVRRWLMPKVSRKPEIEMVDALIQPKTSLFSEQTGRCIADEHLGIATIRAQHLDALVPSLVADFQKRHATHDGHGGTLITDPPEGNQSMIAPPHG